MNSEKTTQQSLTVNVSEAKVGSPECVVTSLLYTTEVDDSTLSATVFFTLKSVMWK
jgi:hypothetical protein